jgi:hypothetical protein
MRSEGILKHAVLAFVLALGFYLAFFYGLEHLRNRRGPWEVSFSAGDTGVPMVAVRHPRLGIEGLELRFSGAGTDAPRLPQTIYFAQPTNRTVPFGSVKFLDTTFLPGTVTLELFGHEVEFLPRTLIIDKQEQPWWPGRTIVLSNMAGVPASGAMEQRPTPAQRR